MNIDLSGREAVITGSTAGIGLAIAQGLAAGGALVTVNGRSEDRVRAAVAAVQERVPGAEVTGIAADLSTAEGNDLLVSRIGTPDILVNNMGIVESKPFNEITMPTGSASSMPT